MLIRRDLKAKGMKWRSLECLTVDGVNTSVVLCLGVFAVRFGSVLSKKFIRSKQYTL